MYKMFVGSLTEKIHSHGKTLMQNIPLPFENKSSLLNKAIMGVHVLSKLYSTETLNRVISWFKLEEGETKG